MPNLSEAQLETVCRTLCKFRNLDPDKIIPAGYSLAKPTIQWKLVEKEVLQRHRELQIDTAINSLTNQ